MYKASTVAKNATVQQSLMVQKSHSALSAILNPPAPFKKGEPHLVTLSAIEFP